MIIFLQLLYNGGFSYDQILLTYTHTHTHKYYRIRTYLLVRRTFEESSYRPVRLLLSTFNPSVSSLVKIGDTFHFSSIEPNL